MTMVTIEFEKDGSGILSTFVDGAYWERTPFIDTDDLEIIAFRMGLLIQSNKGDNHGQPSL